MSTVEQSIDVDVPVSVAYNRWTQFEDFPKFMDGVEEIRQTDATHNHWVTKVAGKTVEFDAEVTEQHPDERVAWKSTSGPSQAGVVTFHKITDGTTRVMLQLEVEPDGVVEQIGDKLGLIKHQAKADMKRFKDYIEERGTESGAWRGDVGTDGSLSA